MMAARKNNNSPYPRDWTMQKLLDELVRTANLESFSGNLPAGLKTTGSLTDFQRESDAIREATRLYRSSWMNPLIEELASRIGIELSPRAASPIQSEGASK